MPRKPQPDEMADLSVSEMSDLTIPESTPKKSTSEWYTIRALVSPNFGGDVYRELGGIFKSSSNESVNWNEEDIIMLKAGGYPMPGVRGKLLTPSGQLRRVIIHQIITMLGEHPAVTGVQIFGRCM